MEQLTILVSLIGNLERATTNFRKTKSNYWRGVLEMCINMYESMFKGQKSRVVAIAKEELK